MDLEKIMFGGAIAATLVFVILSTTGNTDLIENDSWAIEETCLGSHSSDISHTHSSLSIIINGNEQYIPQNVGIQDSKCPDGMRGIHTHDDSGRLHIETPSQIYAPLGAFFNIWGEVFDSDQILDNQVDDEHEIVMFVNGEINEDFENYLMQDNDVIEIHYQKK
tara:strand:- start:7050 stop:7541 length:492 start_codon:yes stop_codon:yes gene_type:complete